MRLIGMLLMGLLMLQPQRAEATVKTVVVPAGEQTEDGVLACETVERPAADGTLGEMPVVWMSGCGPSGRHRQVIGRQRLMRLAGYRRKAKRGHRASRWFRFPTGLVFPEYGNTGWLSDESQPSDGDPGSGYKAIFIETARRLKGYDRRGFMAQIVKAYGKGGQRWAERELGWNRGTIRKGTKELEGRFGYLDQFSARGRKPAEEYLPNLLDDIKAIADQFSQTDPTFKSTRLYMRLSAKALRQQLIEQKGYTDAQLPTSETIRVKLNQLQYHLRRVKKTQPLKKIPETDAIFEQLHRVNKAADADPTVLRLSMDAKATVKLGRFSRGGITRVIIKALDHDFNTKKKLTPYGIFLPHHDELYLYFTPSQVTSDFIVDCLSDFWQTQGHRFPQVRTLVLNQDNGPENHSRRTQFMKRISDFADEFQMTMELAYYPPYHSKYNPVERVWGVLEKFWNGSLLDCVDTVLRFANNMQWNSQHPCVQLVEKTYPTGVALTKKAMDKLEKRFERLPGLEKWFVRIAPLPATSTFTTNTA